jgi:predicted dehydrogenase
MARAPIRLGMVGGGEGSFIGGVHRIAARLDGEFQLVAGALSADPDKARRSGAALGLDPGRSYASYAEMARAEAARPDGIEAVSIVTPNHMHAGPARAFLEAGTHVICDKPLTATLDEAEALAAEVRASRPLFVLTHNYTAYPMVRQARAMVAEGAIGRVRVVAVEYIQGWLATRVEDTGNKQAAWRTDPARSGPAGALGDIGTHAFNLAEFVTGLKVEAVAAEASAVVEGRRVDDNTTALLRFEGGARGTLWCSQVAIGRQNGLALRVYGETGALEWEQERPEVLRHAPLGQPVRVVVRGGDGVLPAAAHASRIPGGHPEGYLEGFAQLYRDAAELIRARREGREPAAEARLVPGIEAGLRGMRFIDAALASSRRDGAWTRLGG